MERKDLHSADGGEEERDMYVEYVKREENSRAGKSLKIKNKRASKSGGVAY